MIQGFGGAGVQLSGAGALGQHDLRCNDIGTSANGAIAVPNAIGVFLDRTVFVHVGGPASADTNLISGNLGAGVGATPNGPGDVDEGANRLQNHPDLGAAVLDDAADEILVSVGLPLDSAQTVFPVDLDFYVADADGEEGAIWIGRLSTEGTDGPREILSLPFPETAAQLAALGGRILAAATDGLSNTSEFGPSIPVPEPTLGGGMAAGLLASFGLSRMRRARRSGASRSSRISRNCACPAVPEPD